MTTNETPRQRAAKDPARYWIRTGAVAAAWGLLELTDPKSMGFAKRTARRLAVAGLTGVTVAETLDEPVHSVFGDAAASAGLTFLLSKPIEWGDDLCIRGFEKIGFRDGRGAYAATGAATVAGLYALVASKVSDISLPDSLPAPISGWVSDASDLADAELHAERAFEKMADSVGLGDAGEDDHADEAGQIADAEENHAVVVPEEDRPTVLFICATNGTNSPMAEALAKLHGAGRLNVESAGTEPGLGLNETAVVAVSEILGDMGHAQPKEIDPDLLRTADRVIVVDDEAVVDMPEDAVATLEHWDIDEPSEDGIEGIERVRLIRDQIDAKVKALVEELV